MDEPSSFFFGLVVVFALVAITAVFVAVEFALVRSNLAKLRTREFRYKRGVKSALLLSRDIDSSLAAAQLGITVASLVLGWWGERTFHGLLVVAFHWLGVEGHSVASHAMATALALVLIVALHVVFGEIVVKAVAIRHPERTLRWLSGFMLLFTRVCTPLLFVLNSIARVLLRVFGITIPGQSQRVHTASELERMVSHSSSFGVFDKHEEEMLRGVFGFSETVAREVMTPRTDVISISLDSAFEDVLGIIVESGYSRFPVTGSGIDDICGVLLSRDLLSCVSQYVIGGDKSFDLKALVREPYFIPGMKPIDDLLNEFKGRKIHFAIVLDEHGGMDGIVTLEDLIEEIVGDIFDESDVPEREIVLEENGDVLLDGGVLVGDCNERFAVGVPEGDYDTIGGFVFSVLGRIPRAGDEISMSRGSVVEVNGFRRSFLGLELPEAAAQEAVETDGELEVDTVFRVEKVESHRVERVRLISVGN